MCYRNRHGGRLNLVPGIDAGIECRLAAAGQLKTAAFLPVKLQQRQLKYFEETKQFKISSIHRVTVYEVAFLSAHLTEPDAHLQSLFQKP